MNRQDEAQRGKDEPLARKAQELLRDSAEHLDAATRSRLTRARHEALAEMGQGRRARVFSQWAPVGMVAATAVLAALLWIGEPVPPGPGPDVATVIADRDLAPDVATDLDLLLAEESLEMIEDLEFFTWLDANMSTEELQAELGAIG